MEFNQINSSLSNFFHISREIFSREKTPIVLISEIELFLENAGENIVYHYGSASAHSLVPLNSFVAWQNVKHIVAYISRNLPHAFESSPLSHPQQVRYVINLTVRTAIAK